MTLLHGRNEQKTGICFGSQREREKALLKVEILLSAVRLIYLFSGKDTEKEFAESFWVDLVVRNPLDAELNLANLTLVVRDMNGTQPDDESHPLVDVDVIEDVFLSPLESRIVSFIFIGFV